MKLTSAQRIISSLGLAAIGLAAAVVAPGCSSPDGGAATGSGASTGDGDIGGGIPGIGSGSTGNGSGSGDGSGDNPETCAIAAENRTYVGCDFWPTVTANPVYPVFDFAAVVANAGTAPAEVTVTKAGAEVAKVTVQPNSLEKIYLPWVEPLKGGNFSATTQDGRTTTSSSAPGGAYHLTSSIPVTVWQFNPLQYKTDKTCTFPPTTSNGNGTDCLSVSNDASILMPSTALRNDYRLAGWRSGLDSNLDGTGANDAPPFYTITATADGTVVTVNTNATSSIEAGSGVNAIGPGSSGTFNLNAGDVVQLVGRRDWNVDAAGLSDLSGSTVASNNPIQIISGVSIASVPDYATTCCGDHFEETLLPVEAWGNTYIVTGPTDATGANRGHYVRIVGNFDGTTLSYEGATPPGAPTTINAGQVWQSSGIVTEAFKVTGSNPAGEDSSSFAIVSVLPGNGNAANFAGDPALTFPVAVPQYRTKYIFLAPDDYDTSFADVLVPVTATATIDGAPLVSAPVEVVPGWNLYREPLNAATGGAHLLEATEAVGLSVAGYGYATGYIYPGGLNIKLISKSPIIR